VLKRRVAIAVALVAVLAGGAAVAFGATGGAAPARGHHARHQGAHAAPLLSAAASYLGISTSQLRTDLRTGESLGQIAASTPGHTEAGLIAAMVAARRQQFSAGLGERVSALVKAPGGPHGLASRRGLRQAGLRYLGIPPRQIVRELRAGKSLAQIADGVPGKSAAGLIDAIVAAAQQRLQAASAAGHVSAARASARLAALRERVTAVVDRTPQPRPGHSRHG
jgi:uncharacterized protein (DUF433 family)